MTAFTTNVCADSVEESIAHRIAKLDTGDEDKTCCDVDVMSKVLVGCWTREDQSSSSDTILWSRDLLGLLFTRQAEDQIKDDTKPMVVGGALVKEYLRVRLQGDFRYEVLERLVYLGKVDTTGLVKPRHAQRPLIIALLYGMLDALTADPLLDVHIYITAKSAPEYLFPMSGTMKSKHVLDGSRLIEWWKRCLSEWGRSIAQKLWYVPGRDKRSDKNPDGWEWGVPYSWTDAATLAIPRFDEDPVSVCLDRCVDKDESVTVETFISMLESSPDFRDAQTGLFYLKVDKSSDIGSQWTTEEMFTNDTTPSVLPDVMAMLNLTESKNQNILCKFDSEEEGLKSSIKIHDMFIMTPKYQSIRIKQVDRASAKRDIIQANVLPASFIKRRKA